MADLENTQGGNNTIEDTGDGRITGQEQQIIDTVNEAIEKGDIEAGGTKLYNHEIELFSNTSQNTYKLRFVSTNKNKIADNSSLVELMTILNSNPQSLGVIVGSFIGATTPLISITLMSNSLGIVCTVASQTESAQLATLGETLFSENTSLNDIVTEL